LLKAVNIRSSIKTIPEKIMSFISRRNLLKLSAATAGIGLITNQLGIRALAAPVTIAKASLTPDAALAKLLAGNQRFANQKAKQPHQGAFRLQEVAQGQKPFAAILGCADSRVPVEILFDRGLGDLFTVRVAGNVATPEEIGSLEYAALLGAQVILVLGHERCGAVTAALANEPVPGQIGSILEQIQPAIVATKGRSGDPLKNAIIANVKNQIATIESSPVVKNLIQTGKLKIVGGYYDLDTGVVNQIA
jgi:carbonic anhydrase